MAGKQKKSTSFMSVFNIFKLNSRHREEYSDDDDGAMGWKVWRSDEDRGRWGVGDPAIDVKAAAFIAQYKKKVTESEIHWQEVEQ